jgi:tetratricopeptide (TPR) repeat protein
MNYLVSGVAAKIVALPPAGDAVTFMYADRPEERHVVKRNCVHLLFADAPDVEYLADTSEDNAFRVLLRKWNADRALRMLQILLDRNEDFGVRQDASDNLANLLPSDGVAVEVENFTFSITAGEDVDFEQVNNLRNSEQVGVLVERLLSHQEAIAVVRREWERIDDSAFTGANQRKNAEVIAIRKGLFRQLVEALSDENKVNSAVFSCYAALKDEDGYRDIVSAWTRDLVKITRRSRKVLEEMFEPNRADKIHFSPEAFVHERFMRTKKQKAGIIEQVKAGHFDRARSFTRQLVDWQLQVSNPIYAAMSLCSLAQEARAHAASELQLEWVKRATEIAPDDNWAHCQAADAYFSQCDFNSADRHFELAVATGAGRYGMTGRAKVLAATGHLDEALKASDLILVEYELDPELHRTYALRGEILRTMWRFQEALEAYELAASIFLEETYLLCGRAAVLTDMTRLPEAIAVYEDVIARNPGDHVAWCGRADVFKQLGELEQALGGYDQAIHRFPSEPFPACGRADVLRTMGRLDEAKRAYEEASERFPYAAAARSGFGEVLREQGRFEEALTVYKDAARLFKHDARVRNGLANVFRHSGRFEDALQEYDRILRDLPYNLASSVGRAGLLKLLGSYDDALKAYDDVLRIKPDYHRASYAKASIFVIRGEYDQALALLPDETPTTSHDWIALHIRGMIHLRKNEIDAALTVFTRGVMDNPFFQRRRSFESALAAAEMMRGRYAEAAGYIQTTATSVSNLLLMHCKLALGESWDEVLARDAFNDNAPTPVLDLRNVIMTFFEKRGSAKDADGERDIQRREIEVILQAA